MDDDDDEWRESPAMKVLVSRGLLCNHLPSRELTAIASRPPFYQPSWLFWSSAPPSGVSVIDLGGVALCHSSGWTWSNSIAIIMKMM